ncbi:F-box/LRR-repeat protein 16 isoform X3 [Acanthochromis polyacanthus]|uniref:F-box/LRR-repeat protein 16 isoform X3 n=1 Tax=Acanthochromis polyacanthus TaxID=80966 RepID=UPI002234704F|nr:F-box/LRR-repeat protein 16 isoform X3 [Acanthochromis polyacanthus]
MLNMSTPSELKSPCVTRNGMVKLPPSQPNGLGSASITKGTPAAKNRLCQSSSVPSILPPPPSSLPYHHHHHLDVPGMPHAAAPLLASDLEPGMPLVGLKPSLRQPPPLTLPKPMVLERQLVLDEKLLNRLLWYFTTAEKCVLAQVCKTWRKVLYQPKFWEGVTPILHAKELYTLLPNGEKEFVSLQAFALRGFQSFCLVGVSDLDICEFIDNYPLSKKGVRSVSLKRSTITDAGLEGYTTHTLRLHSCWEITNHGVVNMVHSLPNLTALSLSGCSKITDDGVELVAENLRKLRSLDLSWCPRITDMALEYIACDLHKLEELVLDSLCIVSSFRCVRITDTGLGYLSTMSSLRSLYLRWCCQVQDFGLQHLFGMRSLRLLSLAGCPLLTTTGLSGLIQLHELEELELTNCPGATAELFKYYSQHLPHCMVIE